MSEADRLGLPDVFTEELREEDPEAWDYWNKIDYRHFDRRGEAISMREWMRLWKSHEYRLVKQDSVENYWVSTVWLGLDHSYTQEGMPIIYETMLFDHSEHSEQEGNAWMDLLCRRYSTELEALTGHDEVMKEVEEKIALLKEATGGK